MYSRNTKNTNEEEAYPFSLPERYGGSRFRRPKEPETKVHTPSTAVPPIHRSVPKEPVIPPIEVPPPVTEPTWEEPADNEAETEAPIDDIREADAVPSEAVTASKTAEAATPSLLSSLSFEDLLLAGLILLLSREKEGHDNNDIMLLLSLLLAYRP